MKESEENSSVHLWGEAVQKIRLKSGKTQEEIADELGVSVQTVSRWERGASKPRLKQQKQIAMVAASLGLAGLALGPLGVVVATLLGAKTQSMKDTHQETEAENPVNSLANTTQMIRSLRINSLVRDGAEAIKSSSNVTKTLWTFLEMFVEEIETLEKEGVLINQITPSLREIVRDAKTSDRNRDWSPS